MTTEESSEKAKQLVDDLLNKPSEEAEEAIAEEVEVSEEVNEESEEKERPRPPTVEAVTPIIQPPSSDNPEGYSEPTERLAYLRPKDEFTFDKEVPYDGVGLVTEYRVVPCTSRFH